MDPVSAWRASENIPAFGSRNILTWDGSAGAGFPTVAQTLALTAPVAAYLAGERTGEGTIYRTRANLLGDIVHSSPVYVKDSDTVYVGANDGMLHAFNASTGREQFAYVPGGINLAALKTLSNPAYAHRYFVDGELVVSTKQQTPDKNILVGLLGAGGKSVYALDVTSPVTMTPSKVLWEFSDPDLGNALGKPVVVELNNGKTGVMFGNGYNSALEHSVLFILDIQTGALIKKLDTQKGSAELSNGMAAANGWDLDEDV
ncbi:MAG: pilus assembly protein, partial [Lysobacterales bacterium CG_4_9_14_3_um_filter_62_6]